MKIIFGIILAVALIFGGYLIIQIGNPSATDVSSANNVSLSGDQQIVEITAKGGYTPRVSIAKAGVPTILRFNTSGTFDCSSSVRIPSMNISQALPATGVTDIPLGTLQVGVLKGSCGMGMYPFEINVQS